MKTSIIITLSASTLLLTTITFLAISNRKSKKRIKKLESGQKQIVEFIDAKKEPVKEESKKENEKKA